MKFDEADLDRLVKDIHESAKYRHLCPDLIRRFGALELANRPNLKTAIQETRSRLHQSAGAYLDAAPPYSRWRKELDAATDAEIPELARQWMRSHASTRERLGCLEEIFQTVLPHIDKIDSVLDIACGLNPLALPWMGLPTTIHYHSCDLYSDMMEFLQHYFDRLGVAGSAEVCDAVVSPPRLAVDLAIILKFLPVLEQSQRGSTLRWLQSIHANWLLISFPTASLGGKSRGMAANYEARFLEAIAPAGWPIRRFLFDSELCFLVKRVDPGG